MPRYGFKKRGDVANPMRLMGTGDREALWRYFTHVVDHAADPRWAPALEALDDADVPSETIALLRAVVDDHGGDVPMPAGLASRLSMTAPADPPIAIRDEPYGLAVYRRWGFLL